MPDSVGMPPSPDSTITAGDIKAELGQLLKKNKVIIPMLRAGRCFTQDADFDWITDNARQLYWLINALHSALKFEIGDARARFSSRDYYICLVDLVMQPIADKLHYIKQQQQLWAGHLRSTSYLDWFSDDIDEERHAFSWKALESRLAPAMPFFRWGDADTWRQKGGVGLKCFFDSLRISDHEKKSHVDHIRKLWSQRKYREKLEKNKVRQRNFVLSDTTMADLDKLAKQLGISRTETLERLIELATKQGISDIRMTSNISLQHPIESS